MAKKFKIEGSGRVKVKGSGKVKIPYQEDIDSTFFYQFFLRPFSSYLRVNYETLERAGMMVWAVFEPGSVITKYNIENGVGTVLKGQHYMNANELSHFEAWPLFSETDYVFARFIRVGIVESNHNTYEFTTPKGDDEPPDPPVDTGFYSEHYSDHYD